MNISPDKLPGMNPLAAKFLSEDPSLSQFYNGDFRDFELYNRRSVEALKRQLPLDKLGEILKRQNRDFGCSTKTLENIAALSSGRACAIVTGQQAGLLTGPLYTIHKAITTIKLRDLLNKKFGDRFVPVFWIASDDHDFLEINHVNIIGKENNLAKISYDVLPRESKIPISDILLNEEINAFLQQIYQETHDSEFRSEIEDNIAQSHAPGNSCSAAFGKWMTQLFKSYGLIMLDPGENAIKLLASDLFAQEVEDKSRSSVLVQSQSRELSANNLPVQVKVKEGLLNLFYVDNERHTIQLDNDRYIIKNTGSSFQMNEMLKIARESPHRFSPNVLLRPIFQDSILPTVAYIAGPSEIAYFSQLKTVYNDFNVPMPIIFPRKSITILERKIKKIVTNNALAIHDFFKPIDQLISEMLQVHLSPSLNAAMKKLNQDIGHNFKQLKKEMLSLDKGLESIVDNTHGKIMHQTDFLYKKILQASKKKHSLLEQQLRKASIHLYPYGNLQERELNIVPFLFKYGYDFIHVLYENADITSYDHQIIEI